MDYQQYQIYVAWAAYWYYDFQYKESQQVTIGLFPISLGLTLFVERINKGGEVPD